MDGDPEIYEPNTCCRVLEVFRGTKRITGTFTTLKARARGGSFRLFFLRELTVTASLKAPGLYQDWNRTRVKAPRMAVKRAVSATSTGYLFPARGCVSDLFTDLPVMGDGER